MATLRSRLDGPISSELKRKIVEILVERVQANTVERFGVQQSELLIAYRFTEPDEPAPLILPRSHRMDSRRRPPDDLNTLGDHLRRRRLILRLLQRQVAEQIGVTKATVHNWETNRSNPGFREMPAIIRFLGYDPDTGLERVGRSLGSSSYPLGAVPKRVSSSDRCRPKHVGALGTR